MYYAIKTLGQLRPILQGFRKKAKLTQVAMAEQLGITQQSYAQIEANPASTSLERLYKILRFLNVELILADELAADASQVSKATAKAADSKTLATAKRPAPPKVISPSKKKESW